MSLPSSAPTTPFPPSRPYSSVPSSSSITDKSTNVMNIQSLLNPSATDTSTRSDIMATPSTTRATPIDSVLHSTSEPDIPRTPTAYGRNTTCSGNKKTTEVPHGKVNFPAFEIDEDCICLSPAQQDELLRQHKLFNVKPCGFDKGDIIAGNTKHIPYASDKKEFFGKTGRDGFNVYQYTFQVPNDPEKKTYTVMWDYENGLVRITPFFKACNHGKTVPAKALSTNPGLKELAHSITGGALAAQGYWVPYQCARAICLTFCYDIRWALVHIFGPSFIRECLPRSDPGFGKFKIRSDIVHLAKLEAQGWRAAPGREEYGNGKKSVPPNDGSAGTVHSRRSRPIFKHGSPFDADEEPMKARQRRRIDTPQYESTVSPRTTSSELGYTSSGWASVNRTRTEPPSPPNNTPYTPLSGSLLTQPRFATWRPAESGDQSDRSLKAIKMPTGAHDKTSQRKRHRPFDQDDTTSSKADSHLDADISETESDDAEDLPTPAAKRQKRADGHYNPGMYLAASSPFGAASSTASSSKGRGEGGKSKVFRTQEYRAAQALMMMCLDDAALAKGWDGMGERVEEGGELEGSLT